MGKRIYVDLIDEKSGVTGTCQLLDMFFPCKVSGVRFRITSDGVVQTFERV